jgi:quinohemoprotein ethanol dehydrogenase
MMPVHPVARILLAGLVTTPLSAQQVDERALIRAEAAEWLTYGRDYAETHYSALAQINDRNVGQLVTAWTWDVPTTGRLEASPLISDGVMYATGSRSFVFALDARTGRELWRWDPMIPAGGSGAPSVCCGTVNRGVALYGG